MLLEGEIESMNILLNSLNQWGDVGEEQSSYSALESGVPDIETLKAAKKRITVKYISQY